jgi:LysM repeat protein
MSVDEIIYEESSAEPSPPEPEPRRKQSGTTAEWIKFVILCLVMAGVVIGVALSRPYVFNQVIPAVLGDFNTPAAEGDIEEEQEGDTGDEPATDDEAPAPPETDEEAPPEDREAPPETEEETEQPVDSATAVPAQIHTIAAGETLSSIARQYGVTLDALIAANEIANPNRVLVGDQLVIPQP